MADLFRKIVEPFVRRNRWSKAAQQQHFKRVYNTFDRQGDKYGKQQIPSATDMADVSAVSAIDFQKQTGFFNSFVYQSEPGKLNRLKVYRDMSFFPEIGFAVGEVVDECINFNDQGEFIQFNIRNNRISQNQNIVANLVKEWKYVLHDVMNAKENIYEWFNDYMIDGEIFFEKVIDPTTVKERGIIRVKRLRPEFSHVIWEPDTEQIFQIVHKNDANILVLPPEAVAYANSGVYAWEDRWTKVVLSYLERAKIDYRKLKQMEDAVAIYRIIKGAEKRVFTIEVGKLPKPKAEAYVQQLMRKYRQRKTYNPETGEAGEIYDPQAMVEDFFFISQDGKGSKVETLPGGQNLSEIDDVTYFLKKLYRGLRIPISRLNEEAGFSLGDTSDVTRDEYRFHKMCLNYSQRFATVFKQVFMSHLQLKGYVDEFGISERDIDVELLSNNLFEEYFQNNIMSLRTENMEKLMQFAQSDEEGKKPLLSGKFVMKKCLKLTPNEIQENDEMLKQEAAATPSGGGGGGDLGGLGGGGGGGGGGLEDLPDLGGEGGSDEGPTDTGGEDLGGGSEPKSKSDKPSGPDLESFA